MLVAEIATAYVRSRTLAKKYADSLSTVVDQFSRHLGHRATHEDFSDAAINGWLHMLQQAGLSETTRADKRCLLLILARYAYRSRWLNELPRDVQRISRPQKVPLAWTHEQLAAFLEQCGSLQGTFRRLPVERRLYMRSLANAAYDTALRIGDVLSLERTWIWPDGHLSLVQHKTGRIHRVRFRGSTLEEIRQLEAALPGHCLIWPPFADRRRFHRLFRRMADAAGLDGATKKIRRASASYLERERPGTAWRHLGHARPGLDAQAYIDPSIAYPESPLPPPIG